MSINLNRFDLVSLRLFVAVLDAGSLTAGAQRFGLSLAAVSKRMADMEAHVGSPLFERRKGGVVATAAGRTVHAYAAEMVSKLEQMALAVGDLQRGVSGRLQLVANTSAFSGFLPQLLAEFARVNPGVALDLEDALSEEAVRAVAGGTAELAIIGENTPCGSLQTLACHRDQLVLAVPPAHALAAHAEVLLDAVLQHDLITLGRATSLTRQLAASADLVRSPLKVRAQVRSFDAMLRMVASGLGLAILPRMGASVLAQALGLRLLPIHGMRADRVLLLAMRNRALLSAPARSFVELVEAGRVQMVNER
jgi:DNA-binding transcriptional LysR family regulator